LGEKVQVVIVLVAAVISLMLCLMLARENQTSSAGHSFLVPCNVRSFKKQCVLMVIIILSFEGGDAGRQEL
jgi:hypothetical protein